MPIAATVLDFFKKKHEKGTPLIKKRTFFDMSRHKKYKHTYIVLILLYFYLFTYYLIFQFFWIWLPLVGGYLHHNILTCINNILTTENAGPNNKTSPCSHPLTLYYSLILWGVISEQFFSEMNGVFFEWYHFQRKCP